MNRWQRTFVVTGLPLVLCLAAFLKQPANPEPQPYHLVKINNRGDALAPWSGPWSCVCDTNTGLLWEVKTDDESIHDGLWTYSWYREAETGFTTAVAIQDAMPLPAAGSQNLGDCYFEPDRCDTADLIRRTREQQLCGENNWRLPSATELRTLVYADSKAGQPAINTAFFPKTKRGDYWTADSGKPLQGIYQHLGSGAEAVSFVEGQQVTLPHRNAAFVRLVARNSKSCH